MRAFVLIAGDVITSETSALVITVVLAVIGWLAFSLHLTALGAAIALVTAVAGTAALCGVA